MNRLDIELMTNRILDNTYEAMRPCLTEDHRNRLDALTPDARRFFTANAIAKAASIDARHTDIIL